jgi:PAS domain S-box-containing protein
VTTTGADAELDSIFPGDGEMSRRMRAHPWHESPLGRPAAWPQSLKTAVRILLTSRFEMWMAWGPELPFLYNDAYRRKTIGTKHPQALGTPTRALWSEIWADIGPRIEHVLSTGEATWDEALLLFLERSGYPEETYHTFSYSPLSDDAGKVAGMLSVVTEETERVIGERRLRTLRDLAAQLAAADGEEAIFAAVARSLGDNQKDLPFTLTYLFDDGESARLACTTGMERGHPGAPARFVIDDSAAPWPARDLLANAHARTVDLAGRFASLPTGAWSRAPERALLVPVPQSGGDAPAGFLVAGLNPFRRLDESYEGFVGLVAGQIGASLANARAYEEERRRAQALAELDRAKTTFFSNVSHEFRTPLTLMLGPVEDILAKPAEEVLAPNRAALEVVHRNGQRLLRLVNTLLDFARIEAGRAQASYEPTNLAALTADLASNFRSACEKAGLRLAVLCPPAGEAFVDREMWEKIVLNLLSNAFKFTLAGGIDVELRREARAFELVVRDTGSGIPEAALPRMFERFHRVDGAQGRSHEGSGIGLALVHELVKLHGGTLRVESRLGFGSTFTVSIPAGSSHLPAERIRARREAASTAVRAGAFVDEALSWLPAQEQASGAAPMANARRVLLADDNADLREYARRLLADHYDVEAVPDGAAALAAARVRRPDLVVTDIMMPKLDGFGLIAALRADESLGDIPVIALSARAGEEARIEGLGRGADDYLTKPFSARELLVRCEALLRSARIRHEAEARVRAVVDTTPDCVKLVAPDGTLLQINAAGLAMVGASSAEAVVGRSVYDLIAPEDRAAFQAFNERVCAGERGRLEFDVVGLGGVRRHMEAHAVPLARPDGGCDQLGITRDVTQRKRQEDRLRESEARLAAEAAALVRLNEASSRLWQAKSLRDGLEIILSATIELMKADYGNVQLLDGGVLKIAAQRGFEREFLEFFREVSAHDDCACGRALRSGDRIVIEDVDADAAFAPFRAVARNAGYRAVQTTPLIARDGRPQGMISTHWVAPHRAGEQELRRLDLYARQASDFIERCAADERLREGEQQLRLALEAGRMGAWEWHIASNRVTWSPGLEALHGLPPGAFDGTFEGFRRDIVPEDLAQVEQAIARTLHAGEEHRIEYRIAPAGGGTKWVEGRGRLFRDVDGRPERMVGVCVDATERKLAEAALLARARQQQAVANLGELALRERDLQQLFAQATASVARALGVEYCKVLELLPEGREMLLRAGVGWQEGLVGRARVDTGMDSQAGYTLASEKPVVVTHLSSEHRFRGPPLLVEHGVVSGMSCIVRTADGAAWGVLGAHTTRRVEFTKDDVSFLVSVANVLGHAIERERAESALRESDRRKDEFIAMLSHELRNPLAPLRSTLELMRLGRQSAADADVREMMERQVAHLVRLVDDLLESSRISRGLLELKLAPVQLGDVLRTAVESAEPLIRQCGHRLDIDLPREALWVEGDTVRLSQVFANLLNNAARYTPHGGRIRLHAARVHGGKVRISVRDSGIGFGLKAQAQLFEMFARGAGSSGLGIGLALARRLVEMHGGGIEASSEGEGHGAEFAVTLALTDAPAHVVPPAVLHAGEVLRVLVADDNRDAAQSLAALLQALGNDVQVAYDGIEAVEAARAFRPNVILLDIGMPLLDGYGAAREIRRDPQMGGAKLVALTGWGQEEDRQRVRAAGFDEHIVKPAELEVLRRVLSEVNHAAMKH